MAHSGAGSHDVLVPIGLLAVIGCMIAPLPPLALDILLCANLLFALLLVIGALHIRDPLRIATLPALLLMATLVRLSLNLATTRAVLSSGHAGQAVEAFGSVVIQGSAIVGFVLFLLITLIQFIVVAKGAERVAEVSARFTLDALPGKQMAIDAELRSGLLDPDGARKKRAEVQMESRFYGALDGAMKFVKGDAIAGLVITFVNIVGGLAIGLLVHHLDLDVAVRRYTTLTIGDGLLSQIPSLLNSVAAGLVVTRVQVDEGSSLSRDLLTQLGEFRAARVFVAVASVVLGCLPGMPHVVLFAIASVAAVSLLKDKREEKADVASAFKPFEPNLASPIKIEVSREFVGKGPALETIAEELEALRAYAFERWGLVLYPPAISLWNDPQGAYRILARGMEVFVEESQEKEWRDLAQEARRTIDHHKGELLDDGVTRRALDYVEKNIPDLVAGVVPAVLSLTQLTATLRGLLREEVSIRHMDVILQTLAEHGGKLSERALLAEIRVALAPVVSASVAQGRIIRGVVIDPLLDFVLARAEESNALVSGEVIDLVCQKVGEVSEQGRVLVSSKRSRAYLRDIVTTRSQGVPVIAREEVAPRFELHGAGEVIFAREAERAVLMAAVEA